ncbi:MAG TPA: hypothetical protein VK348_07555, partial [Planctomycetota bacterium]|nr:hypothetical protein [Planctomycetota bacterium]
MNTRMLPWILLASACGSAPPPLPSPEAAPAPVAAPLPVRAASDAPFRTRLANGLTVLLWPPPLRDGTVALQLALAGGTSQGPQGLADLAAEVLLAAGDATAGRPGLRQSIAGLGGTIEVEHGPVTTWFGVRVPTTNLQPALAALTAALALPTTSRSQIERVRSELLQARALSVWNVPARAVPTRFLLGDRGSGEHLTSLMDRDPSEVVLYAGRHYRPEQAVLAIQAPLEPAALQPMVQDLGHWHAAAASADG